MHVETNKRPRAALRACENVNLLTLGLSFDAYEVCSDVYSATERRLEILGIALKLARRKDPETAEQLPNMRQITRIRHQLLHRYEKVDKAAMWEIVQTGVPAIEGQILALLSDHNEVR